MHGAQIRLARVEKKGDRKWWAGKDWQESRVESYREVKWNRQGKIKRMQDNQIKLDRIWKNPGRKKVGRRMGPEKTSKIGD